MLEAARLMMMTVDGLDDSNDFPLFCSMWCFGFSVWLGYMAWLESRISFFSFFLFFSRLDPRDLIGYGSHTVFVVTWKSVQDLIVVVFSCSAVND